MSTHCLFQLCRAVARTCVALVCALFWQASTAQTRMATSTASTTAAAHDSAANPAAKVPAVEYRSVFKETSLGVEKESTDWRKANNEVGKFTRGHIDILKWEEQEAAKAMKDSMDKPMDKPIDAAMEKPNMPDKPGTTKPIAAPEHKH
jgi:hypothetical protein